MDIKGEGNFSYSLKKYDTTLFDDVLIAASLLLEY